jgi:hypothetical protein
LAARLIHLLYSDSSENGTALGTRPASPKLTNLFSTVSILNCGTAVDGR